MSSVAVIEPERTSIDPMALIAHAVREGMDKEYLVTLFELQKQDTKDKAAAAFGQALAAFQAECPSVVKGRDVKNKDGTHRYSFAGFEDVMTTAGPCLAKFKIAVIITGPTNPDLMDLTVRVRVGIHVEEYPYLAKLPDLNKLAADTRCNECQAFGVAHSYHKRYAVCAALGIKIIGEDTDARLNPPGISTEQVKELRDLIAQCGGFFGPDNYKRLVDWLEVTDLDDLPKSKFEMAKGEIKRRLKKGGAS